MMDLATLARTVWTALRHVVSSKAYTSNEIPWVSGRVTASGIPVSEATALNNAAVWAAVNVISGDVATLPLFLYRRRPGGGKEKMTWHSLYHILHDDPNPEMSSASWRQTLMAHVLLWGNGYSEIQRDQGGGVLALWPLLPTQVRPQRNQKTQALEYLVTGPDGRQRTVDPANMFHIQGLSPDGIAGYPLVVLARESIGLGLAAEQYGARFYGNSATLSGVLKHPGRITPDVRDALKTDWQSMYGGAAKAYQTAILEEGMTWEKVSVTPEDGQFVETRKHQVTDICRWFNIPPHKLRDLERATYSNIEQQAIDYAQGTLRPWLVKLEQEINRKLIRREERFIQFAEFQLDGLLRGDTAARFQAYATGRQWGIYSADDIREFENMDPLPNGAGKIYLVPSNMWPADMVDTIIQGQLTAARRPAPEAIPADVNGDDADQRATPPPAPVPVLGFPPVRRGAVLAAHRSLVHDVVRRLVARETDKARGAAKDPDKLRSWMAEFYPRYLTYAAAQLTPVLQAHIAYMGASRDAGAEAMIQALALVAESQAQLQALLEHGTDDLYAAVDQLCSRWEIERPETLAAQILAEEIDHAA